MRGAVAKTARPLSSLHGQWRRLGLCLGSAVVLSMAVTPLLWRGVLAGDRASGTMPATQVAGPVGI